MRSQSGFVIFTSCIKLPNLAQLWEDFPSNYLNVSSDSRPAHRSATLSQENIPENLPETLQENLPRKAARIGPYHLYCHISYPLGWVSLPISCPASTFICQSIFYLLPIYSFHLPLPAADPNIRKHISTEPRAASLSESLEVSALLCEIKN